nr:hypothetical protein [Abalone asfa-like virus]
MHKIKFGELYTFKHDNDRVVFCYINDKHLNIKLVIPNRNQQKVDLLEIYKSNFPVETTEDKIVDEFYKSPIIHPNFKLVYVIPITEKRPILRLPLFRAGLFIKARSFTIDEPSLKGTKFMICN